MLGLKKLDDNTLVKEYFEGNQNAFNVLATRHKDRIYTYIFMVVKNETLADEIFQETFVKVIKSLKNKRYTENGKFVAWVIRIAYNLIIDYYRKGKSCSTVFSDDYESDLFNSVEYSDGNIEDELVVSQVSKEVRHLVDELSEEQREVVILRHFKGLSYREIAENTGVSINTALGRMRYALVNLRKSIEDRELHLSFA